MSADPALAILLGFIVVVLFVIASAFCYMMRYSKSAFWGIVLCVSVAGLILYGFNVCRDDVAVCHD